MNVAESSELLLASSIESGQRFLLVRLEAETLVFPSDTVSEILPIERSRILHLPFYPPAVIGCVHQAGKIVPIISLRQTLYQRPEPNREILTVIRFSELAGSLAGVGLAIDRVLSSQEKSELPADLFNLDDKAPQTVPKDSPLRLFRSEMLTPNLWQPQSYSS
ncbi:MAG: chemotaxis protein CheW [Cyanosarcina radialis HA8281-LM2]|jgi:chemotaxis signal transduction protein|nr:chemotaxis protein CheW [Cyanosarcina radialis HA8281-LM2]